jgi:hypothetical protein
MLGELHFSFSSKSKIPVEHMKTELLKATSCYNQRQQTGVPYHYASSSQPEFTKRASSIIDQSQYRLTTFYSCDGNSLYITKILIFIWESASIQHWPIHPSYLPKSRRQGCLLGTLGFFSLLAFWFRLSFLIATFLYYVTCVFFAPSRDSGLAVSSLAR